MCLARGECPSRAAADGPGGRPPAGGLALSLSGTPRAGRLALGLRGCPGRAAGNPCPQVAAHPPRGCRRSYGSSSEPRGSWRAQRRPGGSCTSGRASQRSDGFRSVRERPGARSALGVPGRSAGRFGDPPGLLRWIDDRPRPLQRADDRSRLLRRAATIRARGARPRTYGSPASPPVARSDSGAPEPSAARSRPAGPVCTGHRPFAPGGPEDWAPWSSPGPGPLGRPGPEMPGPQPWGTSLRMQVRRALHTRLPSSPVMAISYVAEVRPR